MKRLRAWMLRLAGIFSNQKRGREFAEEMESHLQMHIDDNLRLGMTPEEARRRAILKLGGVEQTTQAYRERSTVPFIESLLQDLHYAIRQLVRDPGFACTAILVLTVGMGASVAIFAFADAALIKPLPYANPTRLGDVNESTQVMPRNLLSYPDYLDWKKLNAVFSSIAVWTPNSYMLSIPGSTELVSGARVSDLFFALSA